MKPVSKAKTRGDIGDVKDIIQYFGSYKLGNSKTIKPAIPPPPQFAANNASDSTKIKKLHGVVQLTQSENSLLDHGGRIFSMTREQDLGRNHMEGNLSGFDAGVYKSEFLGGENSRINPQMECFHGYPSTSNYDHQLRVISKNGVYYGPSCMVDGGFEFYSMDRPSFDLSSLQEILNGGDEAEMSMLIEIFQGCYLDLMRNETLSDVFKKLVDYCRGDQLDAVVSEVLSSVHLFTNAAFSRYGASSIIKLVKTVKKSSHALRIAHALSTQFVSIVTHEKARTVIQHCFTNFPNHLNQILYEKAIENFQVLATDKVGCRSLNEIIKTIAGKQRSRLLEDITNWSYYLSNDIYGNYVVQNVLSLATEDVSVGVALKLRGRCVELAMKPGGSRVVEKCMEASSLGLACVVKEIVDTPEASFELAQDIFGNYVIQTALKKTKEYGFGTLHRSLVKSLEAYCIQLDASVGGKVVLGLLKDELPTAKMASRKIFV